MKTLIQLCILLIPITCEAQMTTPSPLPAVPTTKILAIGKLTVPPSPEIFKLLSTREAPETLRLFLAGKIDQWYTTQNANGVVFIMNLTSVEEAHAVLEALPFGQAKVMTFELIPLGPLSPLSVLLPHADKSAH